MKLLISWDFYAQKVVKVTQSDAENPKHKVSNSYIDGNTLLMREVRGEWPDWLQLTEKLQ